MSAWTWQDYLALAALVLAGAYLWRTRIAPRLRREPTGCDNCAAHQALTNRRSVTTRKLDPQEAQRLRDELSQHRSSH